MALFDCSFFSKSVNIFTNMNVILPENITEDCPTLYLMHGYSDNYKAWMRWSSIERYAGEYNLAVVMPEVQKSYYSDFYGIENGYKYWKFVSEELIEISRRFFRLSHKRENTFVAGLSMGGFGAFKCALNRPDVFGAAASLSGALYIQDVYRDSEADNEIKMIAGGLDKIKGSENDLTAAAEKTAKLSVKPTLYQFCGTDDFLYDSNKRFKNLIQNLGYDYTYEECPGGHEWRLWDKYIGKFINTLNLEKIY